MGAYMSSVIMNWNDLFNYDSGKLYWKIKPSKRVLIGAEAGCKNSAGYIEIWWNKFRYQAHRIIWEMFNGSIPEGMEIDHDNHIRNDNRIDNLNLVSHELNQKNQSKSLLNTSNFTGVTWKKDRKRWHAQIQVNGKNIHLGFFIEKSAAIQARMQANIQHSFHPNHGM